MLGLGFYLSKSVKMCPLLLHSAHKETRIPRSNTSVNSIPATQAMFWPWLYKARTEYLFPSLEMLSVERADNSMNAFSEESLLCSYRWNKSILWGKKISFRSCEWPAFSREVRRKNRD